MLLSSSAESMFWIGRYLERVQALSRAIQSYERASLDLPGTGSLDLRPLLALVGRKHAATGADVLGALVLDRDNPSSVLGALHGARENLRRGRILIAPEVWEISNASYLELVEFDRTRGTEILGVLDGVIAASRRIEGELTASMTRDGAYAFLRIGWLLERADMLLRVTSLLSEVLAARSTLEPSFDDVRGMGILDAVAAYPMYRRRHHARIDAHSALEFVLLDAEFPRSLAYCLKQIERELESLPAPARARAALFGCLPDALALGSIDGPAALAVLANQLLASLAAFHTAMALTYFPGGELPSVGSAPPSPVRSAARDPFELLEREHHDMAGLLRVIEELSVRAERGELVDRVDLDALMGVLSDWGQLGHHEKEEDVLTPLLVAHGFDWYDGPLASMRREHRQERYLMRALGGLSSQRAPWSAEDRRHFASIAREYVNFLREHMRREERELFARARAVLPPEVKADLWVRFEQLDAELKHMASAGRVHADAKRLLRKYDGALNSSAPTTPRGSGAHP
jgi:uncharacterized alpha-E superfamily protein/hemerythrin-like domain-containing protein